MYMTKKIKEAINSFLHELGWLEIHCVVSVLMSEGGCCCFVTAAKN